MSRNINSLKPRIQVVLLARIGQELAYLDAMECVARPRVQRLSNLNCIAAISARRRILGVPLLIILCRRDSRAS